MHSSNRRLVHLTLFLIVGLSVSPVTRAADGAALARLKQCLSCHAVDKKLVGPAFTEVSAKYRGDPAAVDTLVASIKSGSKGKWGGMAMPSNPGISDADLQALAAWVLTQ